jgi:hypothetical protein
MAISSFNSGVGRVRIIGSEAGADQKIHSEDNALKVAGTFLFEEDSIQTFPTQDYQAFLHSVVCLLKSVRQELQLIKQHLAEVSDLEDLEVEPGTDEGAI